MKNIIRERAENGYATGEYGEGNTHMRRQRY